MLGVVIVEKYKIVSTTFLSDLFTFLTISRYFLLFSTFFN